MSLFELIFYVLTRIVWAVVIITILLMLFRLVMNYVDLNPFSRPARLMRNITDPLISPVRNMLINTGFEPKLAPIVAILLIILFGWFFLQLAESVLATIGGVMFSLANNRPVNLLGFILYGLLDLYALLLFIRIILSWGMSRYNPVMSFLVRITEPLLGPLRRVIPPFGFLDLSPLVALLILWLFKAAVAGTLLR
ncbi:MAG: YggT family protein [Pyrinomonadaceae bacterium]